MTWTVQAEADLEPLPAAVEVAAYRIVLESVHNALQHGQATACTVTLRRGEGNLEIERAGRRSRAREAVRCARRRAGVDAGAGRGARRQAAWCPRVPCTAPGYSRSCR